MLIMYRSSPNHSNHPNITSTPPTTDDYNYPDSGPQHIVDHASDLSYIHN